MAVVTKETVTPIYENTTMQKVYHDGVHKLYYIAPVNGYVLHDKALDTDEFDEETLEFTGNVILGFTRGTCSCGANYDFTVNPREFYAAADSTVPADQIFGGDNNHEVM